MEKRRGYKYYKEKEPYEPVFFRIKLLDGSSEKISKNFLKGFIGANKEKVCSYVRCS